MLRDRYKDLDYAPGVGVDCIMLTLDAEKYLARTLNAFYKEVPIRKLFVLDGGSKDRTIEIITRYPRVSIILDDKITYGKGFEVLKDLVTTPWFIFIDVGKIPADGWYDEMVQHTDKYDVLGSKRIMHYEFERDDLTVKDPSKRLLGGPWLIRKQALSTYRVDDDYVWRVLDIVLRRCFEETGGRYGLVDTTYHKCYVTDGERYTSVETKRGEGLAFKKPDVMVYNKELVQQRHDIAAKAIVKYLNPGQAKYFLDDHWMLMINNLDRKWISATNDVWLQELKKWRYKRLLVAKAHRFIYYSYKKIMRLVYNKFKGRLP